MKALGLARTTAEEALAAGHANHTTVPYFHVFSAEEKQVVSNENG